MLSNKIVAAHVLRLYVWEMLKVNEVLSEVTINGKTIIPIVPVQDEPELRDSGKAYIIYGWSENEENNVENIQRGNMAFRIIAEDGEDETAASVNWWSTVYPNNALVGLRFTWVKTILVESADPAATEGGQVEGNVMVGYRYVSSQQVKTFQSTRVDGSNGSWQ
jgi:hypothetical protein